MPGSRPQTIILEKNIGRSKQRLYPEHEKANITATEQPTDHHEISIEIDRNAVIQYLQLISFMGIMIITLLFTVWLTVDGYQKHILPSLPFAALNIGSETSGEGGLSTVPIIAEDKGTNYDFDKPEKARPGRVNTDDPDQISGGISTEKHDYKYSAKRGEGVTHLARSAMLDYLDKNNIEFNRQQKIYFETNLTQDNNPQWLNPGETRTFTQSELDLLAKKALGLSDRQLHLWDSYLAGYPL